MVCLFSREQTHEFNSDVPPIPSNDLYVCRPSLHSIHHATQVLRVLGQRFPQQVDSAVAKISRNVDKTKAASLRERGGSDDDESGVIEAAKEKATSRQEALSCLLVSTFAGAELAQRLPLEQQQGEDVRVFR